MTGHQLFTGHVGHQRSGPVRHGFHYPVFFLGLDVDAIDACGGARGRDARPAAGRADSAAAQPPWPLAVDRAGLLSIRLRDHGARDGSPLGPWMRAIAGRAGLAPDCCRRIVLHTFPRVLGLGFNPVSFWLCLDARDQPRALLAEVNNTFGEHHAYLLAHPDGRALGEGVLPEARKVFHVSPFLPVQGAYRFALARGPRGLQVRITYQDGGGQRLFAYLQGRAAPCTARTLLGALLRQPLQPLTVLARIHWHALRLWRKGVRFHRKPAPPNEEVTLVRR